MFVRVSEMSYFYDLEKPGTFVVANRFFFPPRVRGQTSVKPVKSGLLREDWNELDP